VSGIGIAASAGTTPTAPPPLTVSIAWNGQTPLPVAGASGVAQPASSPWAPNVFVALASGGIPPYTGNVWLENNPSAKLVLAAAPDGVHTTIGWSGFAINEVQSSDIVYSVTDSAGTTVTSRYSGIIVQRTS
jgi:hypothetical protein